MRLTGKGEEDDLLVSPLLGGEVVDGDTAGGDLAALLRPGDVAVNIGLVSASRLGNWAYRGKQVWDDRFGGGGGEMRRWRVNWKDLREHDVLGEAVTGLERHVGYRGIRI